MNLVSPNNGCKYYIIIITIKCTIRKGKSVIIVSKQLWNFLYLQNTSVICKWNFLLYTLVSKIILYQYTFPFAQFIKFISIICLIHIQKLEYVSIINLSVKFELVKYITE